MRYVAMGLAFAAVGFVVVNTVLSFLTLLLWRTVRASRLSARSLFLMRMLPAGGSLALVFGLVLPAFRMFEPVGTAERVGPALVLFFIVAAYLVAAGVRRAAIGWLEARRLARGWRIASVGRVGLGNPLVAHRVPADMPLAALVGIVRPRLYVSDQFLDALSETERRAVAEHEAGHLRSFDNLKRALMSLAPDWLSLSPVGRQIDSAWRAAAEDAADDHAAGSDPQRSLDLASALLKAARLAPMRFVHASNFYDGSTITRRVARLLTDPPRPPHPARSMASWIVGVAALLVAAGLFSAPALRAAYAMTEAAVRLLQ